MSTVGNGDGQHAEHRIGEVKTGAGLIGYEQADNAKRHDHDADAERGLSRVMTCHRRFFDRAYVSEGLRRDGDQDAEHDLRNACVQFLIHSFLSKKTNTADYCRVFLKKKVLFFLLFVLQRRFHPFFISVIAFQWVPYATADA